MNFMNKTRKLIIIGAGEFAEIAYEYFTYDSDYEVVAFSVESEYLKQSSLFNLPVIPFEILETKFSPQEYFVFVAVTFTKLNRIRTRLYQEAKAKGYSAATYISTNAFVWHNVEIGENCFIFENNVLQYHVNLGNNIILWSGNHIGHRTKIADNCFISSHVVISGYCDIGRNCFFGVNSTVGDHISIGENCLIAAAALIIRNAEAGKIYKGNPAVASATNALDYFGVSEVEI